MTYSRPMVVLLALSASVLWGTGDFIGGLLSRRLPALLVVALTQLGGLLTLVAVLVVTQHSLDVAAVPAALVSGCAGAIALTSLYAALAAGTMGIVSPIASLGAVVPVVLGVATGDRLVVLVGIGMVLAVLGTMLAAGPELSGEAGLRPVLLAGVAALGFGLSMFFLDRAGEHDIVTALLVLRVVGSILLGSLFVLSRRRAAAAGPSSPVRVERRDVLPLALLSVADLGANAMFTVAAGQGTVSVTSVLSSLYPVATIVLAMLVLGERMRRIQVVGVVLVLLGVVLIAR